MTDPDAPWWNDAPWWKPAPPVPAQMPAQIDHYAEAVRLLALADTISAILCRLPRPGTAAHAAAAAGVYPDPVRLNAARDAHLQAAQVHATLAGPRPLELRAVDK